MKKHYAILLSSALLLGSASVAAQEVLLDEGFETGTTESKSRPVAAGEGWTTVDQYSGDNLSYKWHNYYSDASSGNPTITGNCTAAVDAGNDAAGPREEILLSPELDLQDTYQLSFTFRLSPMNAISYSRYDFQVRVVTGDNLVGAETVFNTYDQQMLKEAGILEFPIDNWSPHTAKVDLSDFQGEKVRLAFVYKTYQTMANVVWLDDVLVKKFTPATAPVAKLSFDRYNFGTLYVGEKAWSDVIRLTNVGKKGLKITGIDLPAGLSTTLDYEKVDLDVNEYVEFNLSYTALMTTPATGDVVFHTTGGDVSIAFEAAKEFVPEGYQLETFNGNFPPAGWENNGWSHASAAIEGDYSANAGGSFDDNYLRTPRLDLTNGGKLVFTYFNQFDSEEGDTYPEYDIEVQVSYDGGKNYTRKWVSDYMNTSVLETVTVDLGTGTDSSYVRWFYPAVEIDDEGYAYEHSSFTLDRVLLPNVYGSDGVPMPATLVRPKDGAKEVYPRDVVLEWGEAQFATGYKLFVGTNAEATNVVDGEVLGDKLTYTLPVTDYETTYYWKVVPYNAKGECSAESVKTWTFTTQKDASTADFPYYENFDGKQIPTGWLSTTTITDLYPTWTNRRWEIISTSAAYGGKGSSLYTMWLYGGYSSTVQTPEFRLPADKTMEISFVWGDNHPASLIIDESGLLKKQNVEGGNGYSDVVFEVYADGVWTQESYLSENYNDDDDTKYWRNEKVSLAKYAGKTVMFRWTNNSYSSRHRGAALDEILIEEAVGDKAVFNKPSWNAGSVNYGKGINSGDIFTLQNTGLNDLVVKSATFEKPNFTTSIAAGTTVKVGGGIVFSLQYDALETVGVQDDQLTIEFESGYKVTFPVKGETLAKDILYYSFEPNALDYDWNTDFTQIDVDRKLTYELNYYLTTIENDGTRYAFTLATNNNENLLAAHSGNHTIAAAAPADQSGSDDWLSKKLNIGAGATVDFYARNLGTVNSVWYGDNDLHSVGILVSTDTNTETSDFEIVMQQTEMAYLAENEYHHYTVDLSRFEGKNVYVALRHTSQTASYLAFFDDLTFTHVSEASVDDGIAELQLKDDTPVEIYTLGGTLVARGSARQAAAGLKQGVYLVKQNGSNVAKKMNIRK